MGEEALEIAVPGGRRVGRRAVERCSGGVPQGELRPRREVGEIDQKVGAFGRGEDESLRRDSHRREEQPALAADLCDPLVVGLALASEHETEGAGVRAIEQPEPVGRRLDLDVRPDRAVDGGERAEALRDIRVGLVQEPPGHAAVGVGVEVAIGEQERQLVRRTHG